MDKNREVFLAVAEQFRVPPLQLLDYPLDLYEDMISFLYDRAQRSKVNQSMNELRARFGGRRGRM